MVTVRLGNGILATIEHGVWRSTDERTTRALILDAVLPPPGGLPDNDWGSAERAIELYGGAIVSAYITIEAVPGRVY